MARIRPQSTIRFVYPFSFDCETAQERVDAVDHCEWGDLGKVWNREKLNTVDLLPAVGRYLNGSSDIGGDNSSEGKAKFWKLDGNALQSSRGLGGGVKKPSFRWTATQGKISTEFQFASIELVLFHAGIGMLILEVRPESMELNDWMDFIHIFRFVEGRRAAFVQCETKQADGSFEATSPGFGGKEPEWGEESTELISLIKQILAGVALPTDDRRSIREEFIEGQAIPYTSLFIEDADSEDAEILYRLRNLFGSNQQVLLSPEDSDLTHQSLMHYADRQWFVSSLDGSHFVAFDAPANPFFENTLPSHLGKQYFLLFLMALHQRFKLARFSEEVAMQWSEDADDSRLDEFERLNKNILTFRAHGLFGQAGQRDHLHRYYRKLHDVFEIERQFSEVSEEVHDMHAYMHLAQSKKLEKRINQLAVLLGVPGLILGFLGVNLFHFTAGDGISWWLAIVLTILISLPFGLLGYKWLQSH